MKSKLGFFVLIVILFATTVTAQEDQENQESTYSLQFQVIGSLPTGSFGTFSDSYTKMTKRSGVQAGDKIGLAEKGFGLGVEFSTPVWFDGMNWVFSAKVLVNGTNGNEVQSKINETSGFWIPDSLGRKDTTASVDYGSWLNIPLMTGLRYDYKISNSLKLYGIALAGLNFTKAPSLKTALTIPGAVADTTIENTKYDLSEAFGVDLGVGIIFNGKYNLGFRYLYCGIARYDGTRDINTKYIRTAFFSENHITGEARKISMLILTFGIIL